MERGSLMQTLLLGQATRSKLENCGAEHTALARLKSLTHFAREQSWVLLAEIALAAASYFLAVALLSDAYGTPWATAVLRASLGAAIGCGLAATLVVQLFRRSLRYANLLDVRTLAAAVCFSSICLAAFAWWRLPPLKVPAALFALDAALLGISWGCLHFSSRVWRTHRAAQRKHGGRAVIVGDAGMAVLKELALDPDAPFRPVALVDDDRRKWGRRLYGVPIVGGTRELTRIASQSQADEIFVCIPSATHSQMHDILGACLRLNLPVRSLPSLAELLQGAGDKSVSPRDLRGPRIEYLLRRNEFILDSDEVRKAVEGKTILVSGAGGSIGSELARQIATGDPRKLILLDKSENSLFYVNLEVSERLAADRVKPILTDLSGLGRMRTILKHEQPEIIFHAAAHKHVSMTELHPQEAIRNNVLGTRNLAEAAADLGVEAFVNISTDKAVDSQNYMGLSKKITELCIQELAGRTTASGDTRFANVRFGNVAGSSGSVIRLFWEQIQRGGPIRVTDPRASRYFMSVTEAVHLILGAAELGDNGETFVIEMGEPFNIYELARTMALFAGLRPHKDIAIEFIGLRKGEKLSEQLWESWEHPVATSSRRILAIRGEDPRAREILEKTREMEEFVSHDDAAGLKRYLSEIFPHFGSRASTAWQPAPAPSRTTEIGASNPLEAV
jgi:FlaA1/EpsC-like NDP-sugar epimerase